MADANIEELLASIATLKGTLTEAEIAYVLDALARSSDRNPVIPRILEVMENLKEIDAITIPNFDGLDATIKNEGERYRAWKFSTTDLLDAAAEYLQRYAWVKGANPVRRRFVEDCLIDNTVLRGKYRVIGVRKMAFQGSFYIIQILRKGYASEIDWTEAFLVEGHSPRTNEDVRIIEFRYFDPVCVEAARAALKAATFSSPVVQSQTLAGNWLASDIITKPEQDGSYTITLVLKNEAGSVYKYRSLSTIFRSGNTIAYRNWPTPIEAPVATGSGLYRVQDQLSNDGMYDATLVYECGTGTGSAQFRSMSTMFREGSTLLYKSWPTVITAPTATGSGVYRVQQAMQDDGTYDGALVYECGLAEGKTQFKSLSTMFRVGNTVLYKSSPVVIVAPDAAGSGIYRVQQSLQDDGSYDGALVYECGTATGQAEFKSLSTMFRIGNTILYKSSPVVIIAPTATGSGIYRVQQSLQDDGTYDGALVYECGTANGQAEFKSLSTMFRIGNTLLYKSSPVVIVAPDATGSGIYRVQQSLQDDGTYDGALVYECGTANGQAQFKSLSTMFRVGNTVLYKSSPVAIVAPDATGSGIYRVQQSLQDDGTYDGALVYECGTANGQAEFKSLSTMFRIGNTLLYKSSPIVIITPEATGSGIYRVQQSLQDDGTYDGALVYECGTANGKAEFRSLSTMFRIGNTILYKSNPTAIVAPEATGSGIYRVQQSLQDDGTYDGALVYECGTATGKAEFKSLSTMFRIGNTILYKSSPVVIVAPTATGSGIYRVQQSLQDDGTYDGALVYECGTANGQAEFKSLSTMSRVGNTILYKSSPVVIIAPEATGSGIYRVQQSLQDDGTYDGALIYECGTTVGKAQFKSLSTVMSDGLTIVYKSSPTAIVAPVCGQRGIYRVQQSMQDDGTYDGSLLYETSTASAIFKTWNSLNGACYMYSYKNMDAEVRIDNTDNNVSSSSSINEDGTFDTVVSITPPSPSGAYGDWSDTVNTQNTKLGSTSIPLKGPKGIGAANPGSYIVYVYLRKTYKKAEKDVTDKIAAPSDPDTGYEVVPSYGAYHTGIWIHGKGAYQGVVVLQEAAT